jgi:hypothetical protein
LKLKHDEPASKNAFKFNLRRYVEAEDGVADLPGYDFVCQSLTVVGRCRLTLPKAVLKAPMVSALETVIR